VTIVTLDYRILGPLEVVRDGSSLRLGGAKQKAVLAILILHAGKLVSLDKLVDDLWLEEPPRSAVNVVQSYISRLRRLLSTAKTPGDGIVLSQPSGYVLDAPAELIDRHRVKDALVRGKAALEANRAGEASERLSAALTLFRGPALADFRYEPWAQADVEQIEELEMAVREARIDAELALGRHADVIGELDYLVTGHPAREHFAAQLMVALYRTGRQSEALQVYQSARLALTEELGIDPSPQLRALERQVLEQDPSLDRVAPKGARMELREAVGPASEGVLSGNLPTPATQFIGRSGELAEIKRLLGETKLVTLTGPGGTGKTRLAIRAGTELEDRYPEGVWWVPLAPIKDDALVVQVAIETVGVGSAQDLAQMRALVVFDNAEHLLPSFANHLAPLLLGEISILVTSRERLKLESEHVFPVPPMIAEDGEALFVARARQLDPAASPNSDISELCERLEQLPLALELVAARTMMFTPTQLLERLEAPLDQFKGPRDADPRHRSLRAAIAWSYDLLDDNERQLFCSFSVFIGGCTLESAEEVCGGNIDVLESLVDKSLIRRREGVHEPRFWMLETIREYAAERQSSDGAGRDQLLTRHAEHFARYCDALGERTGGAGASSSLEEELTNIRAALTWAQTRRDGALMIRLMTGSGAVWFRGSLANTRDLLTEAIGFYRDDAPLRASGLRMLAKVALRMGDLEGGRAAAERGIEMARKGGFERELAGLLDALATIEASAGNRKQAMVLEEEAIDIRTKLGDDRGVELLRVNVGDLLISSGEFERGVELCEESLERLKELGESGAMRVVRINLAIALVFLEKLDEAAIQGRACLEEDASVNDRSGVWVDLQVMAAVAAGHDDPRLAARLLGAADALGEREGFSLELQPTELKLHEHVRTAIETSLEPRVRNDAYVAGRAIPYDEAYTLAIQTSA
jgi:predicted ATPase/DNA-binding SARP family transcriptional activator